MMHKRLTALGIIILLLLSGCGEIGGDKDAKIYTDTLTPVRQTAHVFPKTSTIGIYVDTTPSMGGFLCTQRDASVPASTPNYYKLCLDGLRSITAGIGKSGENTCFYRVDTAVWKTQENALTEALDPSYYDCQKSKGCENVLKEGGKCDYSYPSLTGALQYGQEEDLFILITDLYENGSENAPTLINKLQELAALDDEKVFGLFAVRTAYAGTVYDIGATSEKENYGLDHEAFRPFYVVVRGYPNVVGSLFDDLEKRLNISEGNCASQIFYAPAFQGLDYQNFGNCVNPDPKKLIWEQGDVKVVINTPDETGGADELPVYDYLANKKALSDEMLFSYSVPDSLREEFAYFAEEFGAAGLTEINGADTWLYHLEPSANESQISRWSDSDQEFQDAKEANGTFTVSSLAYDASRGTLYVGLKAQGLTRGIWRLQWKNTISQENENSAWWKTWGSYSGSKDLSKTERLEDYINAIKDSMPRKEVCILNGSIYFNVKG